MEDDFLKATQMGRGRAGEHPVLHPLPARLAVPTLSLWGSSELHSLAAVFRTL